MASWSKIIEDAPGLATQVQARFDAHRHKTMATLRRDGSPRISGVEANFRDGELWLGMMDRSLKALDLLRDERVAIHSATVDPDMAEGDAKISGRAIVVTDPAVVAAQTTGSEPPGPFHLFRVDVLDVVLIGLGEPPDHLVIESWHEGTGLKRVERR